VKQDLEHRLVRALAFVFGWVGFAQAVNAVGSPFLARSFGLDDAGVARAFAWIACSAPLVLALARQVDRLGRRRVLLACALALPPCALVSAAAPGYPVFVASQIVVQALAGTLLMVATVMIAEELPRERRARGQGIGGVAMTVGAGLCLLLVSALADVPGSWRWAWVATAAPVLALPWLRRALPETARWRAAAERGETARARMAEVMAPAYRPRVVGVVGYVLLGTTATIALGSYPYYHLVSGLGLSPAFGTLVLILGGAVGMLGYPLGGRVCERIGRRGTLGGGALLSAALLVAYYRMPREPENLAGVALATLFAAGSLFGNASIVAIRSASTELFPTRLRSTVNGWIAVANALAGIAGNAAVALLTHPAGGLPQAISWMALGIVPAVLLFWALVPETTGLELEAAALEEEIVWEEAYVSLGSNLGDREAAFRLALTRLRDTPGIELVALSRVYETDPVGPGRQEIYWNAAARLRTCLAPRALLDRLLAIEREAGRVRSGTRDEPRTLDLDLLFFGARRIAEPALVVPHPRAHERPFVLEPLLEIAADLLHPVLGEPIAALAARVRDPSAVRPQGPAPEPDPPA